jgi:flagellar biosynthesis protein FlhB
LKTEFKDEPTKLKMLKEQNKAKINRSRDVFVYCALAVGVALFPLFLVAS